MIHQKQQATGAAALLMMCWPQDAVIAQVTSVTVKFSAAPTTSQALTFTIVSDLGAEYDVLLYSVDPSVGGITSIVWYPDGELYLGPGDALKIAYTNTDTRTYGVTVRMKVVE